jgi:hypothetical protein
MDSVDRANAILATLDSSHALKGSARRQELARLVTSCSNVNYMSGLCIMSKAMSIK